MGVYYEKNFLEFTMKENIQQQYVFVLSPDGAPLMPTKRGGRVRWLLKTGKARVEKRSPFTIQILDRSIGLETQDITLGVDTGVSNIGISAVSLETGTEYVSSTYETNTKGIKAKMEKRAAFRHSRSRFDREKKKRRARSSGTVMASLQTFTVAGAETQTIAKDIRSSICRLNKNVKNGKLSNTAQHALVNHQNIITQITKILPIAEVVFELATFDIHKLSNPDVAGTDYQKGDLFGFANSREYVLSRDKYSCTLCKKKKKNETLQVHHIKHRSKGGSDHHTNLTTLHDSCHKKVHSNPKVESKLLGMLDKAGIVSVATAPATIMNTIMPRISPWLDETHPDIAVSVTYGYITKELRFKHGIDKTHSNDAFVIASGDIGIQAISSRCASSIFKQFSRNRRAWIHGTKLRKYTYTLSNGEKVFCYNRKRAMAQSEDKLSLSDFRVKYGKKAVSALKVVKGTRMWVDSSGYQFSKGDIVLHQGVEQVVLGNSNGGSYVRLVNDPKKNVKPKLCRLIQKNSGFVRVV